MQSHYEPQTLEARLQSDWESRKVFHVSEDPSREKFYCLSMLPYPSGALHMGHVRNYTIGDVIARFQRMQGKNVLQPMGWDAFGLPAENAAIKHNTAPAKWTYANIDAMRDQLKQLGFAIDWSRELATCDPGYYRWEQQMFTRLFTKGLVYRKNSVVNWDPVDQTVLANEQVVDGRGWRSGALVEQREIPQWFLKITAYSDELLNELDGLDNWPASVKKMQSDWIGRSEGVEFSLPVCDPAGNIKPEAGEIRVFTTRPDTSFGMTYAVLAAEHPMVGSLVTNEYRESVAAFQKEAGSASEIERTAASVDLKKRGVNTGSFVRNPFNGQAVPVYLADYVLMGYGTGAIMAVPGQDQRDWDFARAHDLPIIRTVEPPEDHGDEPYMGEGITINSDWLNGLGVEDAKARASDWIEEQGLGERKINYRLRDWGVSRQRYWGCPIPIIYCDACGALPVPEEDLPVILPEDVSFMGVKSPIKADPEWRKTTCPSCQGEAERETDTFDTFMESSWYYARYCSPGADQQLDERADYWLPVDQYIGGIEHAIMHLLYFRFYHKIMRDAGMVTSDEPATRLLCQGMVIGETYFREDAEGNKTWFHPSEVTVEKDERGKIIAAIADSDGKPVELGGVEKMSKSKNNGVDPRPLLERYGADTVRLFSIFAAPPDQSLEWSESGVEGASRFLRRVWAGVSAAVPGSVYPPGAELNSHQRALRRQIHQSIAKVTDDIERRQTFNTAVAALMELSNALNRWEDSSAIGEAVRLEGWAALIRLLSPVTPHIAQAMWESLGNPGDLHDESWPTVDESALVQSNINIVIQVNGKLRAKLTVAADADEDSVTAAARADDNVARFLNEGTERKVIYVPGRLVNFVVT